MTPSIQPGDIISYLEMCQFTGASLQRGMNYHLRGLINVLLMSVRPNAPYTDKVEEDGKVLIYEGHDVQKNHTLEIPKMIDQPIKNPSGSLTQNGLFYRSAIKAKKGVDPEKVYVFEKIKDGIWAYNGVFKLEDAWLEKDRNNRSVYKFKLKLTDLVSFNSIRTEKVDHTRIMPSKVIREVWKRDKAKCVKCGSTVNLHLDHIIPYAKGGSSLTAENIQILCAKHNLKKSDNIE